MLRSTLLLALALGVAAIPHRLRETSSTVKAAHDHPRRSAPSVPALDDLDSLVNALEADVVQLKRATDAERREKMNRQAEFPIYVVYTAEWPWEKTGEGASESPRPFGDDGFIGANVGGSSSKIIEGVTPGDTPEVLKQKISQQWGGEANNGENTLRLYAGMHNHIEAGENPLKGGFDHGYPFNEDTSRNEWGGPDPNKGENDWTLELLAKFLAFRWGGHDQGDSITTEVLIELYNPENPSIVFFMTLDPATSYES